MDGRSWSSKDAVRRDDQFTAAPDFIDPHDSDHLPMWERVAASWHGMAPARRVMVASSLAVFAGVLAVLAVAVLSPDGPGGPPSSSPLADQGPPASSPLPSLSSPSLPAAASQNATVSSPALPPLPTAGGLP